MNLLYSIGGERAPELVFLSFLKRFPSGIASRSLDLSVSYTFVNIKAICNVHEREHVNLAVLYIYVNILFWYNTEQREVNDLPLSYRKLFELLESRNLSATYWLRQHGIHPATVNKLRKGERVNTDTIAALCELLECQPGDILEYVAEEASE